MTSWKCILKPPISSNGFAVRLTHSLRLHMTECRTPPCSISSEPVSAKTAAGSPRNSPEIMDALSHHFCTVLHILHRFVRVCFWRICTFGSSWHSHFSSSGSSHSHFSAFGCCHSHFSLLWSQAGYLVLKPRKGKVLAKCDPCFDCLEEGTYFECGKRQERWIYLMMKRLLPPRTVWNHSRLKHQQPSQPAHSERSIYPHCHPNIDTNKDTNTHTDTNTVQIQMQTHIQIQILIQIQIQTQIQI